MSHPADVIRRDAATLGAQIARGELSSVELTGACLDQIAATDERYSAFLHVAADQALDTAARSMPRCPPGTTCPRRWQGAVGAEGCVHHHRHAHHMWIEDPRRLDVAIRRNRDCADPAGRHPDPGQDQHGRVRHGLVDGELRLRTHPQPVGHRPGAGWFWWSSAAALAAFQAPLAIGSDTGGSIRQPAALTATVGVKPTYGTVSRYGLVACASSLDQGGPCARTVLDTALLHAVIAGHDPHDATSLDIPIPDVAAAAIAGATGDLSGVRIGVVKQLHSGEGYQPGCWSRSTRPSSNPGPRCRDPGGRLPASGLLAVGVLPDLALGGVEQPGPLRRHALWLACRRRRQPQRRGCDGVDPRGRFGPEVKRRIMIGTYALSAGYYDAYYNQAQKVRTLIAGDLDAAYRDVDVLVSPSTPTTAFRLGEKVDDPLAMYLFDLCTLPLNLAGHCGMSVPSGLSPDDNLPVGLQIMAPAMADDRLYRVGAATRRRVATAVCAVTDGVTASAP